MNAPQCYAVWADPGSRWSAWVKPVPFATLGERSVQLPRTLPPIPPWAPALRGDTALILDLPGDEAVDLGLALRGDWRPVPVLNGCSGPNMVVDLAPLLDALLAGADLLVGGQPQSAAPPAFLLDVRRQDHGNDVKPGRFDNRWAVVPQDFPSAALLRAAGITRVVVVRTRAVEDLDHVLYRYREGGIELLEVRPDGSPAPLTVGRPLGFRSLLYRVLVLFKFRRNSAGGFGGVIPHPSSSGG